MKNTYQKILLLSVLASLTMSDRLPAFDMSLPASLELLNSAENEFAPVWNPYEKRFYFNSDRSGVSQFYISEFHTGDFSEPGLYRGKINIKGKNAAYISFISGKEALISRYRKTDRRPYMNLHITSKEKNRFMPGYPVENLQCEGFAGHSAMSPDGVTMIFTSNCYSKDSDTDLLMSRRDNAGRWSEPVPIEEINTPGDEITPFLVAPDTLLFASNGMQGPGGFDLYLTVKIAGVWQPPRPLEELNTAFDESDPAILPGNYIVFASNRTGGKGKLDLYIASLSPGEDSENSEEETLQLELMANTISIRKTVYREHIAAGFYPLADTDSLSKKYIVDSTFLHFNEFVMSELDKGTNIGSSTDTVGMMTSNKMLARTDVIIRDSISISPGKLKMTLNAGPQSNLKRWRSAFKVGKESIMFDLSSGRTLPFDTLVSYNDIARRDDFVDSMSIVLFAESIKGKEFRKDFKLNISTSLTSGFYSEVSGRMKKYIFILPVVSDKVIATGLYSEILEELLLFSEQAEKLEVVYRAPRNKQAAGLYKDAISEIDNTQKVSTSFRKYKENELYSREISRRFVFIEIYFK